MKNLLNIFLLLVAGLFITVSISAEELIDNAFFAFEADEIIGINGTWSNKPQYTITSEQASNLGVRSFKVDLDASISTNVQTTSPSGSLVMDNGAEYMISMKVLVPMETSLSGFTFLIGQTLKTKHIYFADYGIVKDGTWQTISFNYTSPSDVHEGGRLGFRALKNVAESGTFYIDDIMMEGEIPSVGLPGLGFDPDDLSWSVPEGDLTHQPNIIVIMTDEHSIRTIGAYREQLTDDQAYIWGDNIKVETPNIDRIASEGALCTNYYASSPSCTPSRGSFLTGLSPYIHRAHKNDMQMNVNVVSIGEYFKQKGYNTSYIGKWHLNEVTDENVNDYAIVPNFGFDDNAYMYHKAHPKWVEYLDRTKKGKNVEFSVMPHTHSDVSGQLPAEGKDIVYYTEFMTNSALRILDEVKDDTNPFCMMISIPDPHTPDVVHANYYNKYKDMAFDTPLTHKKPEEMKQKWASGTSKLDQRIFDDQAKDNMAQYFGMVDCIDEQVGRILGYLDDNNLTDNTILVFTADHGDMLYEHQRIDKGLVFEASSLVPFIIRYPNVIPQGKIITTPQVNTDFMPTLLGLLGGPQVEDTHGLNCADYYTGVKADEDRDVYVRYISGAVVSLINDRYKLVIANNERPWLFDLHEDPYELVNFYDDPSYEPIYTQLLSSLGQLADENQDPALSTIHSNKKVSNTVKVDVDAVTIINKVLTMEVGEDVDLYALVSASNPEAYASIKTVEWSSSKKTVAEIESNSLVSANIKALAPGETTITVSSIDGGRVDSYVLSVGVATLLPNPDVVFSDKEVKVYPSPFNEEINIVLENNEVYDQLLVYDVGGRVVYQQAITRAHNIRLNSDIIGADKVGLYLLKLIGRDKIYVAKMIKK